MNCGRLWPKTLWLPASLAVLSICLLMLSRWIDHGNDAKVDRIAIEIDQLESKVDKAIAEADNARTDDAIGFVNHEAKPALDLLSRQLTDAMKTEQSPYSEENLALYGAIVCILAASFINMRLLFPGGSRDRESKRRRE